MANAVTKFAISQAFSYAQKDPEKNLPKIMEVIDKFLGAQSSKSSLKTQREAFRNALSNPDSNWYQLIMRAFKDIDPDVLKNIFDSFLVNGNLVGWPRQNEAREKYGCNIPWAILLDPTSACNLKCKGCWAAEYGNKLNLSYEDIDSIITQGKELGTFFYIYTGGEPLVRKDDIIRLCEKHPDAAFLCFTNATLIDEKFADDMLRVKNFIPAISLEGSKEDTDSRRGDGTYDKVIRAMKILKDKNLPFGISACYTSENCESISSEEFYDQLIDFGAYFIWYFHYMPVGADAVPSLMPTPEQREAMYYRIRKYRETKALFGMDFQNDGEFVQGCIAGGRRYLHINANGDVDPCVFIHYSDSNIHEKSLIECLQSPLFMAYHDGQPFNDNMLRPCPMLENPEKLRAMIDETGAHSTDPEAPETAEQLCAKCDEYARNWTPKADEIWKEHPHKVDFVH